MNTCADFGASILNGPIELPDEWGWVRLGELFDIQQGKALNSKNTGAGDLRPFLRTANIFWGKLELAMVDQMGFTKDEQERLALRPGDLLTCEGGDVGRTAMWGGEIPSCFCQNHLHRLRPKRSDVEPEFYMRWMEIAFQQLDIYSGMSNKTTIPNLSKNRLASFAVPHPPLSEQRDIATILQTVQRTKESCERVIAATRQLKQSLLHYLFTYGPVPFDQADQVPLKETELGLMPEHWMLLALGEVCDVRWGNTSITKASYTDIGHPAYSATGPDGLLPTFEHDGDGIVLSAIGARCGKCFWASGKWTAIKNTIVIKQKSDQMELRFLLPYLDNEKIWPKSGSGQPFIGIGKAAMVYVPYPPLIEQQAIATQLSAVHSKLAAEEARRDALASLFQSLLHHLMTGKVRVTA